jgi:hypothetical protein
MTPAGLRGWRRRSLSSARHGLPLTAQFQTHCAAPDTSLVRLIRPMDMPRRARPSPWVASHIAMLAVETSFASLSIALKL